MKAVKYIRISSGTQNAARQLNTSLLTIVDICSGLVPFASREKGSELLKMIERGQVSELHVHSIDRLGRNVRDILETVDYCTSHNVCVVSEKEGIRTLSNGKENLTAKLTLNLLSTLAEFERSKILERQKEGIENAKIKGVYQGRASGSAESIEVFMNKSKTQAILRELKRKESIRRTAKLAGASQALVQKVKRIAIEKGILA